MLHSNWSVVDSLGTRGCLPADPQAVFTSMAEQASKKSFLLSPCLVLRLSDGDLIDDTCYLKLEAA